MSSLLDWNPARTATAGLAALWLALLWPGGAIAGCGDHAVILSERKPGADKPPPDPPPCDGPNCSLKQECEGVRVVVASSTTRTGSRSPRRPLT